MRSKPWVMASLLVHATANAFQPPPTAFGGGAGVLSKSKTATATATKAAAGTGFDLGEWLRTVFGLAGGSSKPDVETESAPPPEVKSRTDAVLVLGGTGKTGQHIVKALLDQGRDVVVAARDKDQAEKLFDQSTPGLFMQVGVDVRDKATLNDQKVFEGVSQVVSAMGPRFGEEGSSSEVVDYVGVQSAIEAAEAFLYPEDGSQPTPGSVVTKTLVQPSSEAGDDGSAGPGGKWEPLDDVIMGGRSSSSWKAGVGRGILERQSEEGMYGRWAGTLIEEGGGFCGTVIKNLPFDASGFDGIRLRVRGDGNRYKFRLKPNTEFDNTPERQYQAAFDTIKGQWIEVDLPFESFVAVKRNYVDYSAPRVDEGPAGGKMLSLGIVLSRFAFNEYANPKCTRGAFQLDVRDIALYKKPRPNFVLVSSASAERYNRLNEEQRKDDIPIVALNPGGILNWKYKAEIRLRQSKLEHCVIRATGLIPEGKEGDVPIRLQAGQGDTISGRVSRSEVGQAAVAALGSPYATGKTFELRRDEAEDAAGKEPDFTTMFRGLVPDADRSLASATGAGLPLAPFPIAQDPPPPVTEERKQEILNDPRVKAQQQATEEGKAAKEAAKEAAASSP